ncbi:MAG TPA: hypothetical protein PKK59_07460 [Anaerolineaceae bacterium]|nr:hypothetical protein [Anaerolineaceae bacterium]
MLFRVLVFILLLAAGYYYARKFRGNRLSLSLISILVTLFLVAFFVLGKKLWAMFGFSMYLMLILLGFTAGILAGLSTRKKKLEQTSRAVPAPQQLRGPD